MIHLNIKPLSVNSSYKGSKYSTPELAKYKLDLSRILPILKVPEGKLSVTYIFGVSSKAADGDNAIKAFQDSMSEKYGFNDRRIYHWNVTKIDVPKGKEFIKFSIESHQQ